MWRGIQIYNSNLIDPIARKYIGALRRLLDRHFNLHDIKIICFDVGIDFEHLEGESKLPKLQNLLLRLANHDQLDELLELLNEERPDVTWPPLPAGVSFEPEASPMDQTSKGGVSIGDVGAQAAIAVGEGASVNVQHTQVQHYDFSGTIAGDVNIAGDVHLDTADLPIPAPPPTPLPPAIDHFVGRQAELAHYAAQLEQARIAVISGMAGMGKTLLASAVAQQAAPADKIFWHTFRPGEGIETIVWQLAAFLAHRQQDELWQMLQRARLTRGTPPPAETLISYLIEMVRGRGYLLCLDDIHHIDDDPQLDVFVERARRGVIANDFQIILTSRKLPEFVTLVETAYIDGLSADSVALLLARQDVVLPPELLSRLHQRTQGNPELVILSVELLRENPNPAALIDHLSEARHVETFILKEIDGRLADDEPDVMNAVSILDHLGYRGTRYAISAVLDGQNVRRVVRDLADRFLLLSQTGERGVEFGQHAIVRDFYYDGLSRRQRQALHHLAGIFYRDEESHPLRAADHFERAGAAEEAAALVTHDVWQHINQGQSRALQDLLSRLQHHQLLPVTQRQIALALGEVSSFLGETAVARPAFEQVVNELANGIGTPAEQSDLMRACFGLGDLLAQSEPEAALDWLAKGISAAAENLALDAHLVAGLYLKTGTIYYWQGDFEQASTYLNQARDYLPAGPSQIRSRVLATLAAVAMEYEQDSTQALDLTEQALNDCRALHDRFHMATIFSNRGTFYSQMGQWGAAIEDFKEALQLAEQTGSDKARAIALMNMGVPTMFMGEDQAAFEALKTSLALADQTDQLFLKNMVLITLADLHIRRQEWALAAQFLEQATLLTEQIGDELMRPLLLLGRAHIALGGDDPHGALRLAEEAAALSRDGEDPLEIGTSLRLLGRIHQALGNAAGWQATFLESHQLLAEIDPYEAGQTALWWGQALLESGATEAGQQRLAEARLIFEQLGAQRELSIIHQLQ